MTNEAIVVSMYLDTGTSYNKKTLQLHFSKLDNNGGQFICKRGKVYILMIIVSEVIYNI